MESSDILAILPDSLEIMRFNETGIEYRQYFSPTSYLADSQGWDIKELDLDKTTLEYDSRMRLLKRDFLRLVRESGDRLPKLRVVEVTMERQTFPHQDIWNGVEEDLCGFVALKTTTSVWSRLFNHGRSGDDDVVLDTVRCSTRQAGLRD